MTLQVPILTIVRVDPETVHTVVVVDANVMSSPEVDVADNVMGETPYTRSASVPKVMVCDAWFTVNVASLDVTDEIAPDDPAFLTTTE